LGAAVTWLFRIETTGVKLDQIGAGDAPGEDATVVQLVGVVGERR
jgi:hypothetical protein